MIESRLAWWALAVLIGTAAWAVLALIIVEAVR